MPFDGEVEDRYIEGGKGGGEKPRPAKRIRLWTVGV